MAVILKQNMYTLQTMYWVFLFIAHGGKEQGEENLILPAPSYKTITTTTNEMTVKKSAIFFQSLTNTET